VSTADLLASQQLRATSFRPSSARRFHHRRGATPINAARQPDLSPLESASETVGRYMKPGAIVVYESTVYPGATEEVCVPILEKPPACAGARTSRRLLARAHQPGDRTHTFTQILKVVSATDAATLDKVADLYASVVKAGVYRASSIAGRSGER